MKKFVSYQGTHEFVDNTTGEIASKRETKILRVEHDSEKFFKIFVENVGSLYGLSSVSSFKVLFAILNMATSRDNVVSMAHGMRKRIGSAVEVHPNLVTKAMKELIEKQIIKPTNDRDYFLLNPHIFGQGSFIDVEKLRQSIEFQYDFKKGEIIRTVSADSITSTGMDILQNPHKYNLIDVEKKETENESNIELTLKHKDKIDDEIVAAPNSESNSLEFNVLKEQNRAKELSIKELELQNRAKELSIKELELKSKLDDSSPRLFDS